jgi:hypothetical protein
MTDRQRRELSGRLEGDAAATADALVAGTLWAGRF